MERLVEGGYAKGYRKRDLSPNIGQSTGGKEELSAAFAGEAENVAERK